MSRFQTIVTGCALIGANVAAGGVAHAQDGPTTPPAAASKPAPSATPRATLTGDWGGLRPRLREAGLVVRADYVSESFAVLDGGEHRGTAYAHQVRFGADLDMQRIAGWAGANLHITFNDRRGVGASSDFVGNRLPIQEAYGGLYTRLTEASYEQKLDKDRLDLRLGFFAMGNDLGGLALGCELVNAAFCAHALTLSGDSGWYNYPNARWGAAIRYRVRPDLALRTGVYQVNPKLGTAQNAFRPFAGGTTGALIPFEIEYDPGKRQGSHVLPGHYKLGTYYDTSRATRQGEGGSTTGRYGVYLLADQIVFRDGQGDKGIALFGEFTAQPGATAQITRWWAAGLVRTGTFPGRDADTVNLGFVFARLNPRLNHAHAELIAAPDGHRRLIAGEAVIECSYGIHVRQWLNVRPDIQYVIHPGAFTYRRTPNALAVGTQVKTQF